MKVVIGEDFARFSCKVENWQLLKTGEFADQPFNVEFDNDSGLCRVVREKNGKEVVGYFLPYRSPEKMTHEGVEQAQKIYEKLESYL